MDVREANDESVFDAPEWLELAAADPHRHIFSTPQWSKLWWEEFGAGQKLIVLTFVDPHPVGLAALTLDEAEKGTRLRFLGGDDLTDYLGPLAANHDKLPAIAESLIGYLVEEVPDWDYFEAKRLPVPYHFAEWMVEVSDRLGLDFELEQEESTAVLPLPGSFDEYVESLPGRPRRELRRKLRRFDEEASKAEIRTATEQSLEADVNRFIAMHAVSSGEKGQFMRPGRQSFFHAVASTMASYGAFSLDFLVLEDRPVAATYSFQLEETFFLYNSAFDPSASRISPGVILVARLIERSIAESKSMFDFLRGEERYKLDLGAQPLPLHTVRISKITRTRF